MRCIAKRETTGPVCDGFIFVAVCCPALWQPHEPFALQRRKVADNPVPFRTLIPECKRLAYTVKQSWEGFSVFAEARPEAGFVALLCHCPHTPKLEGTDDRYLPPCFISRYSISTPAADSPLSPQGAGYGNTPRGLNNTSAARLPAKSATTNTRRRRCESAGSPQYWASKSRQAVSARPPRTIPACTHSPLSGTETSIPVNAWSTAEKSSRSFEGNAPVTFSQTAKAGYRLFVAYLISSIMRMA